MRSLGAGTPPVGGEWEVGGGAVSLIPPSTIASVAWGAETPITEFFKTGLVPPPGATPTHPYYPTESLIYSPGIAPGGGTEQWEAPGAGYGYRPSLDKPGTMDVFMLSDPESIIGTITQTELWAGREPSGAWQEQPAMPRPPEGVLSYEAELWKKTLQPFALLPTPETLEAKTQMGPGQVMGWVEGVLPDGRRVYYKPGEGGQAEVWAGGPGQAAEMIGTVPVEALTTMLTDKYGEGMGRGWSRGLGMGGIGFPREREEEEVPGARWLRAEEAPFPPWTGEEGMPPAATIPPQGAFGEWMQDVRGALPEAAIESFAGLFKLEGEESTAEAKRLMRDVVQSILLSDIGAERARQIEAKEYRAQIEKGVGEEEARTQATAEYNRYFQAAEFMESFVPTSITWDALHEMLAADPDLRAQVLGELGWEAELPFGIIREFPSLTDYYDWWNIRTQITGEAAAAPTVEAEVTWSAERDERYAGRAEAVLGYMPEEGQVLTPYEARAIVQSAMWAGGAEAARYEEALEKELEERPSDYRRTYEEFIEKLELKELPREVWREGR